jgi:hypothetical protein
MNGLLSQPDAIPGPGKLVKKKQMQPDVKPRVRKNSLITSKFFSDDTKHSDHHQERHSLLPLDPPPPLAALKAFFRGSIHMNYTTNFNR